VAVAEAAAATMAVVRFGTERGIWQTIFQIGDLNIAPN
jgi:hypothetical protein